MTTVLARFRARFDTDSKTLTVADTLVWSRLQERKTIAVSCCTSAGTLYKKGSNTHCWTKNDWADSGNKLFEKILRQSTSGKIIENMFGETFLAMYGDFGGHVHSRF